MEASHRGRSCAGYFPFFRNEIEEQDPRPATEETPRMRNQAKRPLQLFLIAPFDNPTRPQ